uniref:Uncharacterized protein n=1 Tax=Daphnia galeata TaxID=27404 RepID=A0A8J2RLK8_9CRUS|nr:unnamed protein product [Daphnia galeata]
MNSLAAMKLSPYYKVLEEEALIWEENLNEIHDLFDLWKDVQGRWEIFSENTDIKALLPVQTSLYKSISSDFLKLMKKVKKSPMVLDVLNINGAQSTLQDLADRLGILGEYLERNNIVGSVEDLVEGEGEVALGEYLERERAAFPRFYFVGDDDLLEIIENSKNIPQLQKHFKKMFAGVSSILLNEENNIVLGIASGEGEKVEFITPVSTIEYPKTSDWLTQVEKEMRVTLAQHLADSVQDIRQFKEGVIDQPAFMSWCDKYEAQIVVLAAQIMWSEDVEAALQAVSTAGDNSLDPVRRVLSQGESILVALIYSVLQKQPHLRRRKLELLINEFLHQIIQTCKIIRSRITHPKASEWLCQMRFYFDPKQTDTLKQLSIKMEHAKFHYGFEYLGVQDRLVQTQLTDRCYLAMTQALESRLGGCLFGPAGTGKTESVKALGHQLGRFVFFFNCNDTFDFQAMGRIFVGLCQV